MMGEEEADEEEVGEGYEKWEEKGWGLEAVCSRGWGRERRTRREEVRGMERREGHQQLIWSEGPNLGRVAREYRGWGGGRVVPWTHPWQELKGQGVQRGGINPWHPLMECNYTLIYEGQDMVRKESQKIYII